MGAAKGLLGRGSRSAEAGTGEEPEAPCAATGGLDERLCYPASMNPSLLGWLLGVPLAIVLYELVRSRVVRWAGTRLRAGALGYVRHNRVRLDSPWFMDRLYLREALEVDGQVDEAVRSAARERDEPAALLRARVDAWIHEIAPTFNLLAYYRFGAGLSRAAVNFCYELVFDRDRYQRAMAKVPEGSSVVFVMNHRSNADYVVLSYGLLRHVALSYAVGEWARVWPLDALFRAFGSYFVRRGEKDRLYHKVLERYVQLLVSTGGTTGFFIEGRLSRTGALGDPKAGLLDYLVGLRREHPEREIVFVPVGLNLDRVFEDRSLLGEAPGTRPPGPLQKLRSLLGVIVNVPVLIGASFVRLSLRAHRKFGYAAVAMGEPLSLSEWQRRRMDGAELAALPWEARKPQIKALAEDLLTAVGRTVPATPVPIFCLALLRDGEPTRSAVTERVRALLGELRGAGAPVALGRAFKAATEAHSGIDGVEEDLTALEEAEQLVTVAGYALSRRGLIRHEAGRFSVASNAEEVLRYYARSIGHHVGWRG